MAPTYESIDDYIDSFPEDVQVILEQVRATIHDVVPDAGEKVSYQMPTITLDGHPFCLFPDPHRTARTYN